jgi:hypothetical protein
MAAIHPDLVKVALSKVQGTQFETFVHEFYASLLEEAYLPLGGIHDGGADGLLLSGLWETKDQRSYLQASVDQDVESKIKATVKRLREVGRDPQRLVYVSNHAVPKVDIQEDQLTQEVDVSIRIRDAAFLAHNINHSARTAAAFTNGLAHLIDYLRVPGNSGIVLPTAAIRSPGIYTFLRQEVDRSAGDSELLDAVVDSMVVWALEGTDPHSGIFMTTGDILEKIAAAIPTAQNLIAERLEVRLGVLARKVEGRKSINYHKAQGAYCLPFETRSHIEDDNLADEILRVEVQDTICRRIRSIDPGLDDAAVIIGATVALRAIQLAYESEGVEFAKFLEAADAGAEFPTIADHLRSAIDELAPRHKERLRLLETLFLALRQCFYFSTEEERRYLSSLSRTYALLFVLRTDAQLVRFFQDMAADFYLYVGADQLVRAISERYLPEDDQMTRTMLKMASRAGAKLILTEPVLNEVVTHIRATDAEYRALVAPMEAHLTFEIARNLPKILLRAYAYSRVEPDRHVRPPKSWESYVGHLCDYRTLGMPDAFDAIRRYLIAQFGMDYVGEGDLERLVRREELEKLTEALTGPKGGRTQLARNDALLALAVYGRRSIEGESSATSVFGYRTWWLTDEVVILSHTKSIVEKRHGARYMMRPDFLLNFIALSPSTAEVRAIYRRVFPSLIGIRMARRLDQSAFQKKLIALKDGWDGWDEGRRAGAIANLSDQLKIHFAAEHVSERPRVRSSVPSRKQVGM